MDSSTENKTTAANGGGAPEETPHVAWDQYRRLETQFLQAQKMEAVGRLAGGVAHDFNNILTAITSYAELGLLKIEPQDPLRRNFEEILAAADRAADLTQQLLAFSRRQILAPKLMDLNAVISDMGRLLRRLIGADVELTLKAGPGRALIYADPAQVEQVIINLAINSRDAMPHGGSLVLETSTAELGEDYKPSHPDFVPGAYVCLALSDTGVGMSEEVKRKIFEPFFTTKDQRTGSGLGLAAVYGIVRQSGGYVWVYSEPDIGTTFKIYFPLAPDQALEARPRTEAAALPRGSETILFAEDDDSVRAAAVEVLRSLGYGVLEASGGPQALELAERHDGPIELLLTDVVMPLMSGRQLYEALAASQPELRVLYTSGYTDDAIGQHGVLEPGTEFLQKPFSPTVLALRVRQVIDRPAAAPRQ